MFVFALLNSDLPVFEKLKRHIIRITPIENNKKCLTNRFGNAILYKEICSFCLMIHILNVVTDAVLMRMSYT